jgi:hypothetical protein
MSASSTGLEGSQTQQLTTSVYKVLFASVKDENIPARLVEKIASFVTWRDEGGTK